MLEIEMLSGDLVVDWNPTPIRKGYWNWEHIRNNAFGMFAGLPIAPSNSITMPGLYRLYGDLYNLNLSASTTKVNVVDFTVNGSSFSKDVVDVKGVCSVLTVGGYKYLKVPVYSGNSPGRSNIKYLEIVQSGVTMPYVSELYKVDNDKSAHTHDAESYVQIMWGDLNDFIVEDGGAEYYIPYASADLYMQVMVEGQLFKPEYKKTEEGVERDGLFFPEKVISTKEYHFTFLATEYLLDALRFATIADKVFIQQGSTIIAVDKIDFNIKWHKNGIVAEVECTFTSTSVTRKVGFYEYSEY